MKFFKKISASEQVKSYVSIFIIFSLMNNLIVNGSENKSKFIKRKYKEHEFDQVYFQNSIPFNEYDDLESQLKIFLGLYSYRSENSFYPDLSIINDSESLREIYKSKLNNMAENDIIYNTHR